MVFEPVRAGKNARRIWSQLGQGFCLMKCRPRNELGPTVKAYAHSSSNHNLFIVDLVTSNGPVDPFGEAPALGPAGKEPLENQDDDSSGCAADERRQNGRTDDVGVAVIRRRQLGRQKNWV